MSFRTWDALLQARLAFKVSFEKPAVIRMGFPLYVTCMFFLLQLSNTLSLLYVFHVWNMLCRGGSFMISSIGCCFLPPTSVFPIYSRVASTGDQIPRRVIPAPILPLNCCSQETLQVILGLQQHALCTGWWDIQKLYNKLFMNDPGLFFLQLRGLRGCVVCLSSPVRKKPKTGICSQTDLALKLHHHLLLKNLIKFLGLIKFCSLFCLIR